MSQIISVSPATDDYQEWSIHLPSYNKQFVEDIKRIPPDHRRWEPTDLCWVVSDEWKEHTIKMAVKYFPAAVVEVSDV